MRNKTIKNNSKSLSALAIIYALLCSLFIPITSIAKPIPENSVFSKTSENAEVDGSFGNIPVYFEQNNGQFNSKVKYFARGTSGYSLFLTATEAVYVLQEPSKAEEIDESKDASMLEDRIPEPESRKGVAVYMTLAGANENSIGVGLEEMPHKTNYFKGEESNWRTEIPNYREIRMNNVYQGIDTVWKGKDNGGVQYDFVVQPNANPNQIEWEIQGAESAEIDEKGDLLIKTEFGEMRQQKPFTYQENSSGLKQEVESKFVINKESEIQNLKSKISFLVGNYDRSKILTIDPSVNLSNLSYSTLLGGESSDTPRSVEVDRAGNVIVAGLTFSSSFPTTSGTLDSSHNGNIDVFITKLNASGTSLVFSTFVGGSGNDVGRDIAIDVSGNIFVIGDAESGYPTTAGAFDETHGGGSDVFVSKLNSTGSSLIYSTFLGGGGSDFGSGIAVNSGGNAFVTGLARAGFPTTSGAYDETFGGGNEAFAAKLNSDGSSLDFSTLIGGSQDESGTAIIVDQSGSIFVTGTTYSTTDFPVTPGAYNEAHSGISDIFVTKLNSSGSALIYSTLIGGNSSEFCSGLAVDSSNSAIVTGFTTSSTYPTSSGAFDTTHGGSNDSFVSKLNSSGTALVYSTFLGGTLSDIGRAVIVDANDNAIISGQTGSTDFVTTAGAYDETQNGSSDAFLSILNFSGTALLYSTFLGGSGVANAHGVAVDPNGNVFLTGTTEDGAQVFPVTSEVFQPNYRGGSSDGFVTKFGDFSIAGRTVDTSGIALVNTAVALSGDNDGFMLSDAEGYFYFGDTLPTSLVGGDYLVSATQTLYNFNPSNYQINVNRNKRITFVGRPTTSGPTAAFASLGGNVKSQVGNVGLANTKLTLIDASSGNATVVHSDANGDYEFEGLLTGTFLLVVPEKEGYDFNPGIYQVNHLDENLGNDFVATPNSPRPVNDFDGDGKTDLAVFRPDDGNWYILESESNNVKIIRFGLEGDIPVAADYDGDNRADIAVYRPSEGNWYRINSSDESFEAVHFGAVGDKPVQADFDGDGKTDYAVFRPSTGVWHKLLSEDGSYTSVQFGIETDTPIAADYDSDGKADLTIFRDGTWYHHQSADNSVEIYQFGLENDKPVVADFDGDGRTDTALFRPSTGAWYWIESSDGDINAKQFGISTDIPTPADYNGDGRYEQSVFRNGTWYVLRNDNSFYTSQFGSFGDIPIP